MNKIRFEIGDSVKFLNKNRIWVYGTIVNFHIRANRYQAVIKCSNPFCKGHKICVHSLYLKKLVKK